MKSTRLSNAANFNKICTPSLSLSSLLTGFSIITITLILPNRTNGQSQSSYPLFDDWPIVKLEQSKLVCDDYQTTFFDDFDGTQIDHSKWHLNEGNGTNPSFHCTTIASLFTDDNVNVNDGALDLTIKWNETPQVLEPPFACCGWEENYCNSTHMVRNVTSGCVSTKDFFNLGRYEARIKFSDHGQVWNAFWMWHHDEIDIIDYGIKSKYYSATHSGNQEFFSSIDYAPCCTQPVSCDYCEAASIDCGEGPNCGCETLDSPLYCDYLPQEFHVFGCDWTPFRVSFYIDGTTIGTVYRYYNLDKTPLIIECGDEIPAVYVKENPGFPYITPDVNNPTIKSPSDIGFRPILWIATLPGNPDYCLLEDCPPFATQESLPASLLVDYVKVETRTYENVSIVPDCYRLCNQSTTVCADLQTFRYNSYWGNPQFAEATVKPLAPPLN